jgi:hypothetical protein
LAALESINAMISATTGTKTPQQVLVGVVCEFAAAVSEADVNQALCWFLFLFSSFCSLFLENGNRVG